MKKHNGMRPQDIVVLLKIVSLKNETWRNIDLANNLKISQSEISEVLNRCKFAGLIDSKKKKVHLNSLTEFLQFGIKYVFPVQPGAIVRGIATAHSAAPINQFISSNADLYVWPYSKGNVRGQSVAPLYQNIVQTIETDSLLYELLVIVDTIRIGRAREVKIAIEELAKRLVYV